jgi:hypothetical protein
MGISSIVTIDGTSYTASQRAAASILPTGLQRSLDGGYDNFTFWEIPTAPFPSFVTGLPVSLTVDIGDGNGAVTRFSGMIVDCQSEHGPYGWGHAYTCQGLKYLADRVPVTAVDGTGTQTYNRSPLDEYYAASDAGLDLGTIIERVLTIPATAQALNAHGIGGYTGLPSAPVLPAATMADLALLTVVPPRPVILQGEGVFNCLDQEVQQWMPKFFSEIEPDGTIRFKDSTDTTTHFPARTITCPSASAAGDPVTTPRVQRSTQNCATRLILRGGPQVEVAILSLVDGTLAEVFTSTDKTNWNLTYFTAPKGATDYGTVTATTSTSATLTSHDNTVTWASNFWSGKNAVITLIDSLATGISQFESRLVTSNDALSAGGSSTVNWDSTWPVTSTSYDKYRITGGSGGLNDCWRTYTPREPATGNTGLNTYVGAHLVTRSAHAVEVANADQTFHAYYTTAIVKGGSLGQEMPLGLQAVPSEGIFRFTQPTVTVFGQASKLNTASPTTAADGLPTDVIVYALYSRGPLSVVVPADVAGIPQYEGTAYTEDGLERTIYLDFPQWLWVNDTTSFTALAQQVLDTRSNAEVDLDIGWYITPGGAVPAWDFLSFGYSLNVAIAGQTSPWSALNAPVRTIGIRWDWTGQATQSLALHASTRRRAFSGFDLYIHPEFAQGSPLANELTEDRVGRGNFAGVNAALGAGLLGGFRTPHDVIGSSGMPASGFTFQDTLAAGMDTGGGIRDPATNPSRPAKPTFRLLSDAPRTAADGLRDDLLGSASRMGKDFLEAQERSEIDARNEARPEQREQARRERQKRARQAENRGNLDRLEMGRRNDARQLQQWSHSIDAAMDRNFPPTDPLNE